MKRLVVLALAACQPPNAGTSRLAAPVEQATLLDLVGSWRWLHRTEDTGTSRVEDETWTLRAETTAKLVGRYVRDVEVRSTDTLPFQCNQRPWYRQRALYDVTVESDGRAFVVHEAAYQTEASPCDHGFRHLTTYQVEPHGNRMVLKWTDGDQTLWHIDEAVRELPSAPWPASGEPTGPWRWQTRTWDDDGNIRDEAEWWEITRRTDTTLDATYRRRVTTHSVDGRPIPCAGAPTWSFDDAYVLDGTREDEHWHLYERGIEAGDHACLRTTPKRTIDEATAEQIGDYLVLEWRGKRRQVLYRPD